MKRIIKKVKRSSSDETDKLQASRITNETVAQHREQILAGGRKFKYPIQYARHRLLINTILVLISATILSVVVVWQQLYLAQNTGSFFYRITQLVPLSVASVDNQPAPYSDYLLEYRSSMHWLQQKSRGFSTNSQDGKRQSEHFKRQSLDQAIENAYAQKLANQNGITVSEKDIDTFIDQTITNSSSRNLSRQSYEAVLSDSYGASPNEYRTAVRYAITKQRVSFLIDKKAKQQIEAAQKALLKGATFDAVVAKYSDDDPRVKVNKGDVGFVSKDNEDQGLAKAAAKLKKGQTSGIIKTSDSYYIIELLDTNADQVRYARIKVSLKAFDQQLALLKSQNKVIEYIKIGKNI